MNFQLIKNHLQKLLLIVLLVSFALSSCEKDDDEIENRDALVGQWDVVENKANPNNAFVETRDINLAYIVSMTRSPVFADEVYIYNFFGLGDSFYIPAVIDGQNINISNITLRDHNFEGSGTISNNRENIEWTYWVEEPNGDRNQYQATYTYR